MLERTFFMIKPDGVQRLLEEEIWKRIAQANIRVVKKRAINMEKAQAQELYAIHKGKPFYENLVKFILSGPVVVSVLEGREAVSTIRRLMGATDPGKAVVGSIRADLKEEQYIDPILKIIKNICHGSDSPESAQKEISIFFKPEDLA